MRQSHLPFHFIVFFIAVALLMNGCAGQRAPEGGPVDLTPPEIISMYPAPNTVNYHDNKIILEFSKYVERRSVEESVFISPSIGDVEFDWSGTEVEIIFHEALRANTTYVFTLGTDVVDVNNHNRLAKAFSLAFSTGEKIDNGTITGKVFDEKPEGVMIFSYRLNDIKSDTLNPITTKPDYITQTGKYGIFTLTNLAYGTYRLYAIRDEFKNLLYDPETDAAGTTNDVTLFQTDTLKAGVQFIIAKEDTTAPRISSVEAKDQHHVQVVFSEPLDGSTISSRSFVIADTNGKPTLPLAAWYPTNDLNTYFTLVTATQRDQEEYVLHVDSVKDLHGFTIHPAAKQKLFKGSPKKDTLRPRLFGVTVRDSGSSILPNDSILFTFSNAVTLPQSDSVITIQKQRDNTKIEALVSWPFANMMMVKPKKNFESNQSYTMKFRWNGLRDFSGNAAKDSTTRYKFSIADPDQFGSVEGSFAGFSGSTVVVQADNIADKKQKSLKTKTSQFGKFSFSLLPEGRYVLTAFEDRNNNFVHDAGKIFPFIQGEKFTTYRDTIRVRARWPIDGVIFK